MPATTRIKKEMQRRPHSRSTLVVLLLLSFLVLILSNDSPSATTSTIQQKESVEDKDATTTSQATSTNTNTLLPLVPLEKKKKKSYINDAIERVESIFKYWIWFLTGPILLQKYWYRMNGRRSTRMRPGSVSSFAELSKFGKKLLIKILYFPVERRHYTKV